MSEEWRIQREIERQCRINVAREKERKDSESALKRDAERRRIQEEIDMEIDALKAVYKEKLLRKEEEERRENERTDEQARLKAEEREEMERLNVQKAEKQAEMEEFRRKKEMGWTDNELALLNILKKLRGSGTLDNLTVSNISNTNLEDIARLLHQNSVSLVDTKNQILAFNWAVNAGNLILTQLLVANKELRLECQEAGTRTDSDFHTTLQDAARLGHLEITRLLLARLPQVVAMHSNDATLYFAICNGHREVAEVLLEHHPMPLDFRCSEPGNSTVLEAAFDRGWSKIIQWIITKYDVRPDRSIVGAQNKTALHLAVEKGHTELVKTFLPFSRKVNCNIKDSNGSTPLLKAAESGNTGIAELLLANPQIKINEMDNSGNTGLLIALAKGHLPLAQLFLDRSDVKPNLINAKGLTALMMAVSLGCSLSVSKLLQHPDVDIHYRVCTTETLWGSLPVQKEWSAMEIASSKGFHYIEHLIRTFKPKPATLKNAAGHDRRSSPVVDSVTTYPSSNDFPVAMESAFPTAPTHDFTQRQFTSTATDTFAQNQYTSITTGNFAQHQHQHAINSTNGLAQHQYPNDSKRSYEGAGPCHSVTSGQDDHGRENPNNEQTSMQFNQETRKLDPRSTDKMPPADATPVNGLANHDRKQLEFNNTSEEIASVGTHRNKPSARSPLGDANNIAAFEKLVDSQLYRSLSQPWVGRSKPRSLQTRCSDANSTPLQYPKLDDERTLKLESIKKAKVDNRTTSSDMRSQTILTDSLSILSTSIRCATSVSVESSKSITRVESGAYSAICSQITEVHSTSTRQTKFHELESTSTSDKVNWGIAAPATAAALLSVGLAGCALHFQKSGMESQHQTISATRQMNETLQKIEASLGSISAVIKAAKPSSRASGDSSADPPPDLPTLSPAEVKVIRYLEAIANRPKTVSPAPQAVMSPAEVEVIRYLEATANKPKIMSPASQAVTKSRDFDTRSAYSSEDHTVGDCDPTQSMNLQRLDGKRHRKSTSASADTFAQHRGRVITKDQPDVEVNPTQGVDLPVDQEGDQIGTSASSETASGSHYPEPTISKDQAVSESDPTQSENLYPLDKERDQTSPTSVFADTTSESHSLEPTVSEANTATDSDPTQSIYLRFADEEKDQTNSSVSSGALSNYCHFQPIMEFFSEIKFSEEDDELFSKLHEEMDEVNFYFGEL
ncbi:hypothetical protein VTL71DRAFT_1063 [Oculimacula yallundae]|uniref:Ankyrin n=1 Tax=Oculimacula yallundae TaxID=86028 RepID=A0ABR4D1T6_9HELO